MSESAVSVKLSVDVTPYAEAMAQAWRSMPALGKRWDRHQLIGDRRQR